MGYLPYQLVSRILSINSISFKINPLTWDFFFDFKTVSGFLSIDDPHEGSYAKAKPQQNSEQLGEGNDCKHLFTPEFQVPKMEGFLNLAILGGWVSTPLLSKAAKPYSKNHRVFVFVKRYLNYLVDQTGKETNRLATAVSGEHIISGKTSVTP